MSTQIAELGRCPTCQRWAGERALGADGCTVELNPQHNRGQCTEGPWHGSLRGPRNACGQWLQWERIALPDQIALPVTPPEPHSS